MSILGPKCSCNLVAIPCILHVGTEVSSAIPPKSTLEKWHIGIAGAGIVIIQIVCTAICITAVSLKKKTGIAELLRDGLKLMLFYIAKNLPQHVPPAPSEHVQSEKHDQGDPVYEDILPRAKDEGTVIELEKNVAYSTTISK